MKNAAKVGIISYSAKQIRYFFQAKSIILSLSSEHSPYKMQKSNII